MTHSKTPARVQVRMSPSGIPVWHVEDYTVPVFSLEFAFMGGASQDPAGLPGLANLMSGLMDEGAGDLDSEAFQESLEDRAIELSFDAERDRLDGSLRSLSEHAGEAFRLTGLALQKPLFEAAAIERVKAQVVSSLKRSESDPQSRARDALYRIGFAGHAYGRPVDGVIASVAALSRADLVAQHRKLLARANLHIVCVGAIGEKDLLDGIETAFAALPAMPELAPVAQASLQGRGQTEIVDLDIPQSTLYLALPGLARADADFMTASVVNHILGGGSFTSRLWTEVREKRGLAYSVWSMLAPRKSANLFMAGTATSNERVAESLEVIRAQIRLMAQSGPDTDELDKAKRFLIGSYALRFDTSRKIANQLLEIKIDDMGLDYIDRRNGLIAAITLEETQRVAARLLSDDQALIVVAGRPTGLI